MKTTAVLALMSTGALASIANAQAISVTGQTRYIEGQIIDTNEGGTFDSGLVRDEVPAGIFGTWTNNLSVTGNMVSLGTIASGFDGEGTIEISQFSLTASGGGGPGMSGFASIASVTSFTFDVAAAVDWTLACGVTSAPEVTLNLSLTGPDTNIVAEIAGGALPASQSGTLQPGTYTLSLTAGGETSFTGPGGWGIGAGLAGEIPLRFVATPSGPVGCPADLDDGSGTGTSDGGVDINDLLYFLTQFEAGTIGADLDNGTGSGVPDGGVDINDLLYFLTRFEMGC